MTIIDRYVSHGLACNPFATPHPVRESGAFFVDRGLLAPPLAGSRTLVQLIGEKGAGKSTQLLEWQRRDLGPYHYIPATPYRDRWTRPPIAQLVYGDEIDRMPTPLRWQWFRELAKANATVVVGTHKDLAVHARRAGMRVITHRLGAADLTLVRAVLTNKVSLSQCGAAQTFALTEAEIVDVHRRCEGSLRTAEVLAHQTVARRVRTHDRPSRTLSKRTPL